MTLTDITNQIVGVIADMDEDEILIESNLKDVIKIPKQFAGELPALINIALKELEKQGLVVNISDINQSEKWILKQPLQATGQNIDISMGTCNEIAEIINSFLDSRGSRGPRADKLNISEAEIIAIINILNEIMSHDPVDDENEE